MTTEQTPAASEQTKPAPKRAASNPSSSARWAWSLLILLLALLACGGYLGVQYYQRTQAHLEQMHQESQQAISALAAVQQKASDLSRQVLSVQSEQRELQQQAQHSADRLAELAGTSRQDWQLAEAEYLLRLANQRLHLERDGNSALSLLLAADRVLQETRNPRLNPVRATLAEEILALRSSPMLDISGAVLRLQALQAQIIDLPWIPDRMLPDNGTALLQVEAEPESVEKQWYERAWYTVRAALASVVRIRARAEPVAAPLTPDQRYYLQQNMNLMLEQAQIALLREQEPLYRHNLQRVSQWLDQYLLIDDERTQALKAALHELQGWQVTSERPDISASLLMLQRLMEQHRRGAVPDEKPVQGTSL